MMIVLLLLKVASSMSMEAPQAETPREPHKQGIISRLEASIQQNAMHLFALSNCLEPINRVFSREDPLSSEFDHMQVGPSQAIRLLHKPSGLALSPDGKQLAVAHGLTIDLFTGGAHTRRLLSRSEEITGISLNTNELLYTHQNGSGFVITDSGSCIHRHNFKQQLRASLLSRDGRWKLLEGIDEEKNYFLHIINEATFLQVAVSTKAGKYPKHSFATAENGTRFIAASKTACLFYDVTMQGGVELHDAEIDDQKITFLNGDVTHDGNYFLFATRDRVFFYKHPVTDFNNIYRTAKAGDHEVHEARFCPRGNFIAIASTHGVFLFDWEKGQSVKLTTLPIYRIAFNDFGDTIALCAEDAVYSTSYADAAERMSLNELELVSALRQEVSSKVLANDRWRTIFDGIENKQLKKALTTCFGISNN